MGKNIDLLCKFAQTCKDNKVQCEQMVYESHIANLRELLSSCNKKHNEDEVYKTFEYLEKHRRYLGNSEKFAKFRLTPDSFEIVS